MNKNYGSLERPPKVLRGPGTKKNVCILCPSRVACSPLTIQTKCQLLFSVVETNTGFGVSQREIQIFSAPQLAE